MCGIAGWVDFKKQVDENIFTEMRDSLIHRGPDDFGNFFSVNRQVALGHRRLSFLDLSEAGHQPMSNEDATIWIVLNGEIYNFRELANVLKEKGHIFKSTSDTEVLIHGYEEWGIDGLLKKIKGMFAFALLDEKQEQLYLVRDRFGIKPLYYHTSPDRLIFASELKAIMKSGVIDREINYSAFSDYFVYRYVPSPKTIWKNINKLSPAHYLRFGTKNGKSELVQYWNLIATNNSQNSVQLANEIGEMIYKSVSQHSRSDVEIGSFLSGGYDSSAIVYYLSQLNSSLKTFSIGFENWDASEHQFAEIVADQFKVSNKSLIAGKNSLDVLENLSTVYDEPIADISIIPTYLVSQLASGEVKAVMSGEGADELFGGYEWQKQYYAEWHPAQFTSRIKNIFKSRSDSAVSQYANYMSMGNFEYDNLTQLLNPDLHKHVERDSHWFYRQHYNSGLSPLKSFQYMDIKCFMGELVLTKIDRASMAHSLEVRVPFLDHELFEKIFSIDEQVYFKSDVTKYLLYMNIKDKVPKQILNRNKQGFVGPDAYYMDISWYSDIILNGKLISEGIINKPFVDTLFETKDHWRLWKIAVMENWFNKWA